MITSSSNQHIKRVRSLQTKRSARLQEGAFVIEGTRLLEEALRTGRELQLVLHTEAWATRHPSLLETLMLQAARAELVADSVLASCSDVETPQGVLAVLPLRIPGALPEASLVLVLDRFSDPGNLGTVLRSALAAQVDRVYLTPGSVDAYNPKVVRSGMGAHFSLEIRETTLEQILSEIKDLELWAAEARQGQPYYNVDWRAAVALAVGSEAHGLDPALTEHAVGRVHIPIAPQSESLNAASATAVILFEMRRQRDN